LNIPFLTVLFSLFLFFGEVKDIAKKVE